MAIGQMRVEETRYIGTDFLYDTAVELTLVQTVFKLRKVLIVIPSVTTKKIAFKTSR